MDNDAFMQAASELDPSDFSTDSHRRIFACMCELFDARQPIDGLTLSERLGDDLVKIGGYAVIGGLVDGLPDRPSIESYVQIVREKSALRQVIKACNLAIAQAVERKRKLWLLPGAWTS